MPRRHASRTSRRHAVSPRNGAGGCDADGAGKPGLGNSPGWSPVFNDDSLEVRVPFDDIGAVNAAGFAGVTAALRVNASVHNPLLCVVDVFKVASGDLSLPGKVTADLDSAPDERKR